MNKIFFHAAVIFFVACHCEKNQQAKKDAAPLRKNSTAASSEIPSEPGMSPGHCSVKAEIISVIPAESKVNSQEKKDSLSVTAIIKINRVAVCGAALIYDISAGDTLEVTFRNTENIFAGLHFAADVEQRLKFNSERPSFIIYQFIKE